MTSALVTSADTRSVGTRHPDVVFGGIYKAGTTFLRGYFTQHPQITWTRKASFFQAAEYTYPSADYPPPPPADARCFIDMFEELTTGHIFGRDVDWPQSYLKLGVRFADVGVRQDQDEIARRVKQTLPEARILLVLRNQVDWMRSAYLHHLAGLPERHNRFADFLATPQGRLVAGASRFDLTIAAYQEHFGKNRVHVMLLEELQAEQDAVLRRLCDFLDVDFLPYVPLAGDRNTGKGAAVGQAVRAISRTGVGGLAARLPEPIRKVGRRAVGALFRGDVLTPEEKGLIRSFCVAGNAQAAGLTGLDLARFGYPL